MIAPCSHCGRKVSDRAPYCSGCGKPVTAQPLAEVPELPPADAPHDGELRSLPCPLCRDPAGLEPSEVPKFRGLTRVAGYILALPGVFGLVVAALLAVVAMIGTLTGGGAWAGAGLGPALILAAGSVVVGLLGWLLLGCQSAWLCRRCGHFLARSWN